MLLVFKSSFIIFCKEKRCRFLHITVGYKFNLYIIVSHY
jgi:hypothetical protein